MVPEELEPIEEFDDEIDTLAAKWISGCAESEAVCFTFNESQKRLSMQGLQPLVMKPKNFGIIRYGQEKQDLVINRIEVV